MVRPATPGTVVVLAATILLVLVSVSTPIIKSIYFLTANLSVSIASVSISGTVNLGVFGYCVEGIGSSATCLGPQLGYELDANQILGNTSKISIPNSLIKWLTYALIIHPIAAGVSALSLLFGIISHFREFSRARMSTWVASLASTLALLAFVFDMVAFSIAKSRLNSANTGNDAKLNASLGNGIWLTLVAFLLLFVSSCFFGFGTRISNRRPRQDAKDAVRPRVDAVYASNARRDAQQLEMAERARQNSGTGGLPAFPEEERIPLTTAVPGQPENHSDESVDSQAIDGVGTGYGRGHGAVYDDNAAGIGTRNLAIAGARGDPSNNYTSDVRRQGSHTQSWHPSRPYPPRRQSSASTGLEYAQEDEPSQQQRSRYTSPAPVSFPSAYQHGGREPSQYQPSSNPLYQSAPTYPPPVQSNFTPPRIGAATPAFSNSVSSHPPPPPIPWLPPVSTGNAIVLPQGHNSFHTAAADSRRGPDAGYTHAPLDRQNNPGSLQPHYQQSTNVHQGVPIAGNVGPSSANAAISSPPYDIYEYYSMDSPAHNNPPPVSIPYAPAASQTPAPMYRSQSNAPTYNSHEPYPTYGGNVYR